MPFFKDKRKLQSRCQRLENLSNRNGLEHTFFNIYGDKYAGEWKNNLQEGKGSCLTRTFKLYEGCWAQNFRHGFGIYSVRLENETFLLRYRGDWKNGHFKGFGERHYVDGGFYLGFWKNSKRHGYGQMWYTDGAFYDGDWCKDMRHNLGLLVEANGNRYEGQWAEDLKHGKGRFFHLDSGQMQKGIWKNDICVSSYFVDILLRQAAVAPTPYPIQIVRSTRGLVNIG